MADVNVNKHSKDKASILMITSNKFGKLFEIDFEGKVFWIKNKKRTQAKVDADLAKAMGQALYILCKMNAKKLKKSTGAKG